MSSSLLDILDKGPEAVLDALSPPPDARLAATAAATTPPPPAGRSTDDAPTPGSPSVRAHIRRLRFGLCELEIENERLRDELLAVKARAVDEKQEIEEHFELVVTERDRLRLEYQLVSQDLARVKSQLTKAQIGMASPATPRSPATTATPRTTAPSESSSAPTTPTNHRAGPVTPPTSSPGSSMTSPDAEALMFREVDRIRESLSRVTNERDRALAHKARLEELNAQLSAKVEALKDAALRSVGATEADIEEAASFPVTPPANAGPGDLSPANNVVYLQQLLIASKLRLAEVLGEHDVLRTRVSRFESLLVQSKYELAQALSVAEDRLDLILMLRQQSTSSAVSGGSSAADPKGPSAGSPPPVPRKPGSGARSTSAAGGRQTSRPSSVAGGSHGWGSPDSTKSSGSSSWLPSLRLFGRKS